jgi:hypothetical protein
MLAPLAVEPSPKYVGVRQLGEAENNVVNVVPPHRMASRGERQAAAELVHDVVLRAVYLVRAERNLVRPTAIDCKTAVIRVVMTEVLSVIN